MKEYWKSLAYNCLGILSCILLFIFSVELGWFSGDGTFKQGEKERSFYEYEVDYSTPCLVVRYEGTEMADSCRKGGLETDGTEKEFTLPDNTVITMSRAGEGEVKIEATFHGVRTLWRRTLRAVARMSNS